MNSHVKFALMVALAVAVINRVSFAKSIVYGDGSTII